MLACFDVDYRAREVVAACVAFDAWTDAAPRAELVQRHASAAAAYEPGRFYLRELPYLLALIDALREAPEVAIVDGHVWLAGDAPGLGARLYEARSIPVVGVAKRPFHGATRAIAVARGASARPLFVTAIGVEAREAAERVRRMHGAHRIPSLLKRVDRLCRDA